MPLFCTNSSSHGEGKYFSAMCTLSPFLSSASPSKVTHEKQISRLLSIGKILKLKVPTYYHDKKGLYSEGRKRKGSRFFLFCLHLLK